MPARRPSPSRASGPEPRLALRREELTVLEFQLAGVASAGESFVAFAYSPTGQLYAYRAGDRLADGVVRAVESTDVLLETDERAPDLRRSNSTRRRACPERAPRDLEAPGDPRAARVGNRGLASWPWDIPRRPTQPKHLAKNKRAPGAWLPGLNGHSRPAHHRARFNRSRVASGLAAPAGPGGVPCASISRSSRFPEALWRRPPTSPARRRPVAPW